MNAAGIAACVIAAAMTVGWIAWALGRLGDSVRPPAWREDGES